MCFDFHKKMTVNGSSTCHSMYRCKGCETTINKKLSSKVHKCGDKYCNVCKDFFSEEHQCYMMPVQNEDIADKLAMKKILKHSCSLILSVRRTICCSVKKAICRTSMENVKTV